MNSWHRIVVKVGTSTIVNRNGQINYPVVNRLAQTLSSLQKSGHQILLVTSGAIGVALDQMNLEKRPQEIPQQQALAAIGQGYLMSLYNQSFAFYQQLIGQVLLTYDVFDNKVMLENTMNAIEMMFSQHVIPIVNENDVIAVDELDHQHSFGDNDRLAAIVTREIGADGLIILSDVDGLYTANPNIDEFAQAIDKVTEITDDIRMSATGSTSGLGTGGMSTKLAAGEFVMKNGGKMVLINGNNPALILEVIAGKTVGTLFQGE
ncbi:MULTISPECIES: glutamate 5-kinase [Leuconostoc]|uniref:Glutamate 5-kinase n=2 Tax=Leuconostoc TaxID=1243 RepID=A0A2N9KHF4_9LACO|nr:MULTISPECIES: glutamate 5-kinase [Leuconostoc]API71387.1 gamma-glutamyl kinase [Leuconostoc suionicum]MBE4727886.1 glutamate 5-kinase [Leuconostoc suionicum]MCT4401409.1 glutamate 5-kinase [Leuconostoc suionicum]MDI6497646.1 glutamate 5-kinase [Leuconostoc suionicum]MDI6499718.1 glutamate 5-kinase [Leuconostoc suionicum]